MAGDTSRLKTRLCVRNPPMGGEHSCCYVQCINMQMSVSCVYYQQAGLVDLGGRDLMNLAVNKSSMTL